MRNILLLLLLASCTPEHEIQVQAELWVLKDWTVSGEHAWLKWENKDEIVFAECINIKDTANYRRGLKSVNRIMK